MTKRCLDEAQIQSYLDGELPPEEFARAEAHLAACPACGTAAREAEEELSVFMRAFEADSLLSVPTERLRARVEAAVDGLRVSESRQAVGPEREGWSLRGWLASLAGSLALTPSRAVAFGGLAAALALGVIFAVVQSNVRPEGRETARVDLPTATGRTEAVVPAAEEAGAGAQSQETRQGSERVAEDVPARAASKPRTVNASLNRVREPRRAPVREARPAAAPEKAAEERLLPGEEKYLQSIAALEKTVKGVSDRVLEPSVRASFERNVEVVNQAIGASRRNALRNPKDKEAAKFLFSAYQSKVELLSAVVEQAQVAALNR